MKVFPLVWATLMRRKLRTIFTVMSIAVAFVLFGTLMALRAAFSFGAELAGADTLMMFQKVSPVRPLPLGYRDRIAATPGVAAVTHATWFGGTYQNQKHWLPQMAVDSRTFLEMHPEYVLAADERRAWLADRTGCIASRDVSTRFGWQIGDRIPLRRPDGSAWVFTLRGIFDAARRGVDLSQMFFHYEYFNESRTNARDTVGWYVIRVSDSAHAADVAARLDSQFANSADQTKTTTTKAFLYAWARQIGDIGAIVIAILGTVLFTILLVTGNTIAQSVRERLPELAVLKTLGFSNGRVFRLVLMESLGVAVVGGALGLGLAWLIIQRGDPTGGLLPAFYMSTCDFVKGSGLILGLGFLAGAIPAWQAQHLRIIDAMRR